MGPDDTLEVTPGSHVVVMLADKVLSDIRAGPSLGGSAAAYRELTFKVGAAQFELKLALLQGAAGIATNPFLIKYFDKFPRLTGTSKIDTTKTIELLNRGANGTPKAAI